MENDKDLEQTNDEIKRSAAETQLTADTEKEEKTGEEKTEEGSGIYTADGKELPKIDGGYDIIEPGGSLGDDEFVSS